MKSVSYLRTERDMYTPVYQRSVYYDHTFSQFYIDYQTPLWTYQHQDTQTPNEKGTYMYTKIVFCLQTKKCYYLQNNYTVFTIYGQKITRVRMCLFAEFT